MTVVAGPTEHPAVAANERACNSSDGLRLARTASATIGGHKVEILHQCGGVPANSVLAIETTSGWFLRDGFTIEDYGANMADWPFDIHLVGESLAAGTLADGSAAIVYQSISRHGYHCGAGACKGSPPAPPQRVADLLICAVGDPVTCTTTQYTCPAAGCAAPALVRGALATVEAHTYSVDARR